MRADDALPVRAVAVIPARYASSRLPGKPLLVAAGRTLVEHVFRRVARATTVSRILVATDEERIAAVVRAFGGEAVMTSPDLPTGSDRIGAALHGVQADIVVNVQGDEPEIEPELVDALVRRLARDPALGVATASAPWPEGVPPEDPNRVKVVTDRSGRALYFSRSRIPAVRDPGRHPPGDLLPRLHVGVYAYRRAVLERFLVLAAGRLEQLESLEQLRLLENGIPIGVVETHRAPAGVDTPADFAAFRARVEGGGSEASSVSSPNPR